MCIQSRLPSQLMSFGLLVVHFVFPLASSLPVPHRRYADCKLTIQYWKLITTNQVVYGETEQP
jgi:hypothetical protein